MSPAPFRAVVDASVAVKLFVPEALSAEAQAVFARFAQHDAAELIVPDLFLSSARTCSGSGCSDPPIRRKLPRNTCAIWRVLA